MGSHSKTASIPSPSRKRLLADLPKPTKAAPPPPDNPPFKKTRDLPNLSECHSCNSRTDTVTGKNPVKFMYSEWRVVILCKRCLSRVNSSEICSYCFKASSGDCVSCCRCKRAVHRACFLEKKSVVPWSYSRSESENLVCIDCWIPDSISRKRGLLKNSKIEDSRVSSSGDCATSLQDSVKNADCVEQRNDEIAARVEELAEKKVVVVVASNALDSAAKGSKVDDVKLALQLHRAINSSPRISKNRDRNCAVRQLGKPRPLVYARRRSGSFSEPIFVVGDMDNLKSSSIVYARRRRKGDQRNSSCKLYYGLGSEASGDMLKYSRRRKGTRPDKKDHLCLFKYSRRGKGIRPDEKPDCLLKYSRRKSSSLRKPCFFMQKFNLGSEASTPQQFDV